MSNAQLTQTEIERLAAQLVAARTSGVALAAGDVAAVPAGLDDAYRVQDAVMAALGRRAAGWKVGAANPTAEPNCAPIYDGTIAAASAGVTGLASTGVELEIAFTLGTAFAASATAPSREQVEAAIGAANIVLETCASRLAQGLQAPDALKIADNGINLGLVIGPQVANWRAIDAARLVARVEANGATIAETTGGHTCPDIVGLLTWLVGHCVTRRGGIAAGTVVTTGSWMGIRFVEPPVTVRGTFAGFGAIATELRR